ncbi:non-homologous end joining protein Ku [Camelimonas fluminis]|uniref:Non-homologous end joining protein Ku n=1 Tax=Camelimonas fluminis TaxID=1576911 RepID=A0ABV7UDS6_9HYPH|nr:Ku protein [Camelimonas fluminis]GHE65918.1 non-homologous end joining protein Ku [Camelimonas fluminis]
MAPRANWKGVLRIAEVICPVALFTAASTSDRIAFHTINRATGHRVHRQFVDGVTGRPVERDDQAKGYELAQGDYIVLTPEEVAEATPASDKTIDVSAFIPCSGIDDVYFDRPYYLTPSDLAAHEPYALIRDGLRKTKTAAIGRAVLFRRVRTLLIRAAGDGLIATTLNFDYEVRPAAKAFSDIPELKIKDEMLELAGHIIRMKAGTFDPATFDDRYEAALADLVKAKLEGRKIVARKPRPPAKVGDLMAALRESAGAMGKPSPSGRPPRNARPARSKTDSVKPEKTGDGPATRTTASRRKAG